MCEYIIRAHLGLSKNVQWTILNISGAACEPDLNPEKWLHETGAIVVTSAEVRSPAFKVRGSMFKVQASPPSSAFATANTPHCHSPLATRHSVIFACPRTALEYLSRRWCRASAFPSHAGNRHNTGRPTEAHEDLFTGKAAQFDAERESPLRLTMPTEADTCRKFVVKTHLKCPHINSRENVPFSGCYSLISSPGWRRPLFAGHPAPATSPGALLAGGTALPTAGLGARPS